jgi:hypothetical protein
LTIRACRTSLCDTVSYNFNGPNSSWNRSARWRAPSLSSRSFVASTVKRLTPYCNQPFSAAVLSLSAVSRVWIHYCAKEEVFGILPEILQEICRFWVFD